MVLREVELAGIGELRRQWRREGEEGPGEDGLRSRTPPAPVAKTVSPASSIFVERKTPPSTRLVKIPASPAQDFRRSLAVKEGDQDEPAAGEQRGRQGGRCLAAGPQLATVKRSPGRAAARSSSHRTSRLVPSCALSTVRSRGSGGRRRQGTPPGPQRGEGPLVGGRRRVEVGEHLPPRLREWRAIHSALLGAEAGDDPGAPKGGEHRTAHPQGRDQVATERRGLCERARAPPQGWRRSTL